ncbi:type II secretion system major pseudopilin GspG [Oceanimonas baumannii]|uniref:Type II secretion system core protein G n=1 Tax=Oceanimonas baumannii TaxID=129578 RepID=A0A235CFD5_9GAMM|nr:type II secretion system major pseudopilin GspG [Oceanimonas baumannii]OYD22737.1 type II secretion system protein GspG [Oceanimonas baumannii]TDW57702.1 general secretion pathway protein G [Oceanimonas baumannii]
MRYQHKPYGPGFTLLELLVVLVILGLLASLAGPQVLRQLGGSKTKAAVLQIKELSTALDLYRLEVGRHPNTGEGLQALLSAPSGAKGWNGPYLNKKSVPLDPWGNEYQYRSPGQHGEFDLFSLGADNQQGGSGEAQDVVSWE